VTAVQDDDTWKDNPLNRTNNELNAKVLVQNSSSTVNTPWSSQPDNEMVTVDDFLKVTTLRPVNTLGVHKRKGKRVYKAKGHSGESTGPTEKSDSPGSTSLVIGGHRKRCIGRKRVRILITRQQKNFSRAPLVPLHSLKLGTHRRKRGFLPKQWSEPIPRAPKTVTSLPLRGIVRPQYSVTRRALEFESLDEHERKLKEWYGKRSK
jgi:hypothetical protein